MSDPNANLWSLLFKDGPCAGRSEIGGVNEPPHDNLACDGMVYSVYRVGDTSYLALPPTEAVPHVFTPEPAAPVVVADGDVLRAWETMWHGIGRRVPQYVNRTKTLRGRIRAAGTAGRARG